MRIGVDIDSLVERDMMRMQAVFQDRRSLVFGISISGSKEEVLFLLKEAYRKGAKTILFTANNRGDFRAVLHRSCSDSITQTPESWECNLTAVPDFGHA